MARLSAEAAGRGLDAVAIMPGPNLTYLLGLSYHLSERPILALLPLDGPAAIVLPKLEAAKISTASLDLQVFAYTDEEGYAAAFRDACAATKLAARTVGVEALRIRLVELRLLEQHAPCIRFIRAEDTLASLRSHKDAHEIEQVRRAVQFTEAALETAVRQLRVGTTERELAARLTIEMLRLGADGPAFAPIVVACPNAALPHAGPSDRPIGPGETITVDCGAAVGGYAADITRTFAIGQLPPDLMRVYETVRAANGAGRAEVHPGVSAETVDRAARAFIDAAGYGQYFVHRTGHGLGLEIHEPPYIVAGNQAHLEPGMVFTIEPGIYLPGVGGVRIEDDVVVTSGGSESLTTFPRELILL
ncbi:MAG: aminopeptidase P family protein [Anaerolineales bacterium]|nr:aminopeptidase P family protein [Anaerolineales bacterium]